MRGLDREQALFEMRDFLVRRVRASFPAGEAAPGEDETHVVGEHGVMALIEEHAIDRRAAAGLTFRYRHTWYHFFGARYSSSLGRRTGSPFSVARGFSVHSASARRWL